MFYHYRQNNSYGCFVTDERLDQDVIIEASSPAEADKRAESLGIYFEGVRRGTDCSCCGDRWHRAFETGDEVPSIYGEPVTDSDTTKIHRL
jgi:hypothetical protein